MNAAEPTDEELAARVGQGDESGLSILYDRYARPVYSVCLRILGNQQVAEEITQEVFVRVWQQSGTYSRSKGRFASWILSIAHHAAIDEVRRRKARPQPVYEPRTGPPLLDRPDSSVEPETLALGSIRREAILEALRELPENQRAVLELAYFQGLTQTEIAERIGEPLGTIKTRTRLALQRLRANLVDRGLEPNLL